MAQTFERELEVAMQAVARACRVCRSVQADLVTAATIQKKDKSPVTVADFASQAVICHALSSAFPGDPVVGEEDAKELRSNEGADARGKVVRHVNTVMGEPLSEDAVLAAIDRGGFDPQAATSDRSRARYWTLDPIDGTKGFLRGEQYAVALGLIVDGRVVLGVLGCPNLPVDHDDAGRGQGVVFAAVRGHGATMTVLDADSSAATPIRASGVKTTAAAKFCESVESGHTDQGASVQIAATLGITAEPFRIDSQCKYAAVARGDAEIYLRLPTRANYREKIWDHAAGMIVVEEAGGTVTDADGKPLDFSLGRELSANRGVIATCGPIHRAVVDAVAPQLA